MNLSLGLSLFRLGAKKHGGSVVVDGVIQTESEHFLQVEAELYLAFD